MVARTVHSWVAVLVGVIGGLAGVIMLVDPTSHALWAWVLVAVVVLALREAYVRYLQKDLHSLDPVPFPLEDDDHWHAR